MKCTNTHVALHTVSALMDIHSPQHAESLLCLNYVRYSSNVLLSALVKVNQYHEQILKNVETAIF